MRELTWTLCLLLTLTTLGAAVGCEREQAPPAAPAPGASTSGVDAATNGAATNGAATNGAATNSAATNSAATNTTTGDLPPLAVDAPPDPASLLAEPGLITVIVSERGLYIDDVQVAPIKVSAGAEAVGAALGPLLAQARSARDAPPERALIILETDDVSSYGATLLPVLMRAGFMEPQFSQLKAGDAPVDE